MLVLGNLYCLTYDKQRKISPKNNDFVLSAKDILEFEEEHGKIELKGFRCRARIWIRMRVRMC